MKTTRNFTFATYSDLLKFTGLDQHHTRYVDLYREASALFCEGQKRAAFNLFYKMWLDPHIVPALILGECFTAGLPIVPTWKHFSKYTWVNKPKSDGTVRPIVVPSLEARVSMGVVNSMLQASCESWTLRTHGFRAATNKFQDSNLELPRVTPLTFGTKSVVVSLNAATNSTLALNSSVTLVLFDIKKAFNSVDLNHLFNILELHQLPKDIKHFIWQWQHTLLFNNAPIEGLAQGFPYSPTLFAWYLDTIFLKTFGAFNPDNPDFFIYADNVVGVFATEREARHALQLLDATLLSTSLRINPASVKYVTVKNSTTGINLPWLGHALRLPECNVVFGTYQQHNVPVPSTRLTKNQWFNKLTTSDWKSKVYAHNWRLVAKY